MYFIKHIKQNTVGPQYFCDGLLGIGTHSLSIINVLKHVEAVVDDGLQYLLVFVGTLANAGQIGHNIWQQVLVVLWEAPKLTFGSLDLLLNVNPEEKDSGE